MGMDEPIRADEAIGAKGWAWLRHGEGARNLVPRLEQGLASVPDLAEAAKLYGRKRACFSSAFRTHTGRAFGACVHRWRMLEAWRLCHDWPDLREHEVAARVGYRSVTTFVRLYGAYWGETPRGVTNGRARREAPPATA